ncbi:MAG: SDR family NAD(P)-dependent oxidoreductase [Planctomycetes bacterium]|nr:SDR family NAD(P)-dependent oxidoreductase [Planctomycetota bacterium]MBM4058586.1 SDR family NAD(P)-dependent oxidoreductase [Planctomycetota bacterium]
MLLRRFPSRPDRPATALVTGGASGLGRALAERLAIAGWRVAVVDLPGTLATLSPPTGVLPIPGDVREAATWRGLHSRLRDEWGDLTLLVNAAGVGATGEVGTLPEAQWRRVLDTNLLGTALGCETFVPWLRSSADRTHLVNVASIAAVLAPPSMAAYAASKAGVVAISEAIAAECPRGRPGVTVVCPGFFRSGLLDTWHFTSTVERREAERRMAVTGWSSERVADRVMVAINRNHRYVVVGTQARWLWRLKRLAPRTTTALIRGIYRRLR